MHRSALVKLIVIFAVLALELVSGAPAFADEGIPDELLNKSGETAEVEADTDDEKDDREDEDNRDQDDEDEKPDSDTKVHDESDEQEADNDEIRARPVYQDNQGNMLQGRADLNYNPQGRMPPVAPPIRRMQEPPFSKPFQQNTHPLNLAPGTPEADGNRPTSKLNALKNMFELGASKDYGPIVRPNWIPGHAYTNQNMVAPYHNRDIAWWDKSKMPDRPQWVILSTSVTKYWRGYTPNPCWILVAPNPLAPGNFTFRSKVPRGPRGWLQDINRTSKFGFPLYRYWLDQPQFR